MVIGFTVWAGKRPFGNTGGATDYFGMTLGTNGPSGANFPDFGVGVSNGANPIASGPTNRSAFSGFLLWVGVAAADSVQMYDNGTAGTAVTTSWGGGTVSCNSDKYIGVFENGGSPAVGTYFAGDVAEIIVYNQALSAGNRVAVQNYLNAKWTVF